MENNIVEYKTFYSEDTEEFQALLDNHTEFQNCEFRHIEVSPRIYRDCSFWNCTFNYCNLDYVEFESCKFNLTGFFLCSIHSTFRLSGMEYTQFKNCCMKTCTFNSTSFLSTAFFTCKLDSTIFDVCSTMTRCNFEYSSLRDAQIQCVMTHCEFSGSDISETLFYNHVEHSRTGIILDKPMIGYKKLQNGCIAKLEIPEGNIVFSINGNKCRTNSAKVLDIRTAGGRPIQKGYSIRSSKFEYEVGKMVYPRQFNLAYNIECGGGIHFFKTKKEAKAY